MIYQELRSIETISVMGFGPIEAQTIFCRTTKLTLDYILQKAENVNSESKKLIYPKILKDLLILPNLMT